MKQFSILFLLAIISTHLMGQVHWTKYPDNPVMLAGTSGDWDKNQVSPSTVIYQDSMYHMWYSGGDFQVHRFQIGYASSPDGINWTKDTLHNPVLKQGPEGAWDDRVVSTPSVLFRDSTYHMWYQGTQNTASGTIYKIGHATSSNGVEWIKDAANNPVLAPGPAGSWDADLVGDHSVIHDGNNYHMWYVGGFRNGLVHLGHATSMDGSNWTKDSLNPVLIADEIWKGRGFEWAMVVYDDTVFHLWYHGGGLGSWVVGYASSLDGINWTKDTRNPIFKGTLGTWNEKYISGTAIIDSAHIKYKMWYGGITSGLGYADIGYAESDTRIPFLFVNSRPCFATTDTVVAEIDLDGVIYIVPDGTTLVKDSINTYKVASEDAMAESEILLPYAGLSPGRYSVVAVSNIGFVCTNPVLFDVVENPDPPNLVLADDSVTLGDTIFVTNDKDGTIYLVIKGTTPDNIFIQPTRIKDSLQVEAGNQAGLPTIDRYPNGYLIYAKDDCGYWSEAYEVSIVEVEDTTTSIGRSTDAGINIFPNPADDLLTIKTVHSALYFIEFNSLNGQLIFSREMEGTTHQIDLSSFQKGVYFITIRSEDFVTTRIIIRL